MTKPDPRETRPLLPTPKLTQIVAIRAFSAMCVTDYNGVLYWQLFGTGFGGIADINATTNMHPCDIENEVKI